MENWYKCQPLEDIILKNYRCVNFYDCTYNVIIMIFVLHYNIISTTAVNWLCVSIDFM